MAGEYICYDLSKSNWADDTFGLKYTKNGKLYDIRYSFVAGGDPYQIEKEIKSTFGISPNQSPIFGEAYRVDNVTTLTFLPGQARGKMVNSYEIELSARDVEDEQMQQDFDEARQAAPVPKL